MIGYLPSSSSVTPHHDRLNIVMHSEAVIDPVWRCTWRRSSCTFGDTLGGSDRARLDMHLEATIVCSWRSQSSEFGDTLGGCNLVSLEMDSDAII